MGSKSNNLIKNKKEEMASKRVNKGSNLVKKRNVKNKFSSKKVIKKGEVLNKKDKIKLFIKRDKNLLLVGILFIIDVILIVCFAKDNYANYAKVNGESIFVGKTRNLLFGRNYIGLIVTLFIYFYGLLVNKVCLKNKLNIKWLVWLLVGLLLFNMLLFYGFTNKIY